MTQLLSTVIYESELKPSQLAAFEGSMRCFGEGAREVEMPVRQVTLLGLELLLHEPVVDLQSIVSLLLEDDAAAHRVVELAAREAEPEGEVPARFAECIATLDLSRLFVELSQHTGR